jgi:hypothetical protein
LNPDDDFNIPDDFVDIIAIAMARAATSNNSVIELNNKNQVYLNIGI